MFRVCVTSCRRKTLKETRSFGQKHSMSNLAMTKNSSISRFSAKRSRAFQQNHGMLLKKQQSSLFHHTAKREILPLIAVGVVAVFGRYAYRAVKRMDDEWQEYEDQLLESGMHPSQQQGQTQDGMTVEANKSFQDGFLGIDLGSMNFRLSHMPNKDKNIGPQIIESRAGGRSTPALVENSSFSEQGDSPLFGSMAKSKFHERKDQNNAPKIQYLRQLISNHSSDNGSGNNDKATRFFVASMAQNALEKVVGTKPNTANKDQSIFSLLNDPNSFNARPICTYNPSPIQSTSISEEQIPHKKIIESLCTPESIPVFIPEPIASSIAAEHFKLVSSKSSIAIIDIGGYDLSFSILKPVQGDKNSAKFPYEIIHHVTIPDIAGDAVQSSMVNLLLRDFKEGKGGPDQSDYVPLDGMGLQRLNDAAEGAIMDLSKKTRTSVNIPFLSVNMRMEPRHLEMDVSRNVLEQEVNNFLSDIISSGDLLNKYNITNENDKVEVKDLSSLVMTILWKGVERANVNPFLPSSSNDPNGLSQVLLLGGGSRSPIFQNAVRKGLAQFGGDSFAQEKLLLPKDELVEELVVLGASIYGSSSTK